MSTSLIFLPMHSNLLMRLPCLSCLVLQMRSVLLTFFKSTALKMRQSLYRDARKISLKGISLHSFVLDNIS
jgi:hypothetical protein